MIKLSRLFLLIAFLFASCPRDHFLIVNNMGNLQIVAIPTVPSAANVVFAPTVFVVEANANSPPANA